MVHQVGKVISYDLAAGGHEIVFISPDGQPRPDSPTFVPAMGTGEFVVLDDALAEQLDLRGSWVRRHMPRPSHPVAHLTGVGRQSWTSSNLQNSSNPARVTPERSRSPFSCQRATPALAPRPAPAAAAAERSMPPGPSKMQQIAWKKRQQKTAPALAPAPAPELVRRARSDAGRQVPAAAAEAGTGAENVAPPEAQRTQPERSPAGGAENAALPEARDWRARLYGARSRPAVELGPADASERAERAARARGGENSAAPEPRSPGGGLSESAPGAWAMGFCPCSVHARSLSMPQARR